MDLGHTRRSSTLVNQPRSPCGPFLPRAPKLQPWCPLSSTPDFIVWTSKQECQEGRKTEKAEKLAGLCEESKADKSDKQKLELVHEERSGEGGGQGRNPGGVRGRMGWKDRREWRVGRRRVEGERVPKPFLPMSLHGRGCPVSSSPDCASESPSIGHQLA